VSKAISETLKHNLRQALNKGRLDDAENILAQLRREDALSPASRGLELEFYLNSNRLAEADSLARQLRDLFPDSARIHFLAGRLSYRQKRYEEADACFRESLRLCRHWQTQHWLGKTLTQIGKLEEAESLLCSVLEEHPHVLLDIAWLHERRGDLEAALDACDDLLARHPGHTYAAEQRMRIRALMLEPDEFINEVSTLADLDEDIPAALFPEYVRRLFETGQSPRARDEILARMKSMDAKVGVQIAWVCYQAHAYDLACTLFLAHLALNDSNFKYLNALESAAAKCNRLSTVVVAYRDCLPKARHLYGRCRKLTRRTR